MVVWDRKIDILEGKRAKVFCTDGSVYLGFGIGDGLGTNANGEDEDAVRFRTDNGNEFLFIESDIDYIELLP